MDINLSHKNNGTIFIKVGTSISSNLLQLFLVAIQYFAIFLVLLYFLFRNIILIFYKFVI